MARFPERLVALGLLAVACAPATLPTVAYAPSTHRDPPTWSPSASDEVRAGEPGALVLSGGAEQARGLLVALVLAVRDARETDLEALLAERVAHTQGGLTHTTWTRAAILRQVLAAASVVRVDPDLSFDALIDPATIQVGDVGASLEGPLPFGVEPGDQLVTFTPTALGRRLLSGLGSTALVIRPGPTPLVVAR